MAKMNIKSVLSISTIGLALLLGVVAGLGVMDMTAYDPSITVGLAVLGLIIGIMNVKKAEFVPFLVGVLVLALTSTALGTMPWVGMLLREIGIKLSAVFVPVGVVLGLALVYSKVKN